MEITHELIEYTKKDIPIRWLLHSPSTSTSAVLPHWHSSIEISYVYEGEVGNFTINNHTYPCKKGNIFIVNPSEVHSSVYKYCKTLKALTIQIPYSFLATNIRNFNSKKFIHFKNEEELGFVELREALDRFYEHVSSEQDDDFFLLKLNYLIYKILNILCEFWMMKTNDRINYDISVRNLEKLQPILNYIQEKYSQPLSIDKLAEEFHMSKTYMSKFFKKNMGLTISKYIHLVRVSQAQQLLVFTEKPIHIVSDLVGFPNEKSFRKNFEEIFHITPKQYQIEKRNERGA